MMKVGDGMLREKTRRKEEEAMRWANHGKKPTCRLGREREKEFAGPQVDLGWSLLLLGLATG